MLSYTDSLLRDKKEPARGAILHTTESARKHELKQKDPDTRQLEEFAIQVYESWERGADANIAKFRRRYGPVKPILVCGTVKTRRWCNAVWFDKARLPAAPDFPPDIRDMENKLHRFGFMVSLPVQGPLYNYAVFYKYPLRLKPAAPPNAAGVRVSSRLPRSLNGD